ncbi:MAG: pseudouridine-5'-phosphate glycosidase [Anaerolineae bacterium]|nr:pseudouridine-5'-phosphate glycosidase [Anaerolineae bacterium]MDW8102649.1 pseudouridine-5'-phosphate glycosidase [Anaerolineae bacterium]
MKALSFEIAIPPEAVSSPLPKVALESVVITFGLPYPHNLEVALGMERAIHEEGAIPLTVAVIGGKIKAGLSREEIEFLARAEGIRKVSRREIPFVVASGGNGATTVSGTVFVAGKIGVRIVATGGLGGVHRGSAFDISADLPTVAETPVAIVCSGAKSILDLEATLEWLETWGVPVIGFGTQEFPAFYTSISGLPLEYSASSVEEAARFLRAHWALRPECGAIVAVPVPRDKEIDRRELEEIVEKAQREAEERGIKGKSLTPFLLQRLAELSEGKTLEANKALLLNNAKVAAQLARALTESSFQGRQTA